MTPKKRKPGRPRTSLGWASVSVRLPLPTVEAFRALPEGERARVREAMKAAIRRAIP